MYFYAKSPDSQTNLQYLKNIHGIRRLKWISDIEKEAGLSPNKYYISS